MTNISHSSHVFADEDPRFVTALARGLAILSCFQQLDKRLTHQQICEQTGLPKATVTRLLFTLIATEFISYDEQGKGGYYLGKNALALGQHHPQWRNIEHMSHTLLKQFAEQYHVSVNIARHQAGMMHYVACYRSPARISVNLQVGSQVPIEQTAIGRAFYACANVDVQHTIQHYLQKRLDEHAFISALQTLTHHQHTYQHQGFSVSNGEYSDDILAVAVAIGGQDGQVLYSINASVPRSQWQEYEFIDQVVQPLQHLAKEIEHLLESSTS